jgi:hypothetical protein
MSHRKAKNRMITHTSTGGFGGFRNISFQRFKNTREEKQYFILKKETFEQ